MLYLVYFTPEGDIEKLIETITDIENSMQIFMHEILESKHYFIVGTNNSKTLGHSLTHKYLKQS